MNDQQAPRRRRRPNVVDRPVAEDIPPEPVPVNPPSQQPPPESPPVIYGQNEFYQNAVQPTTFPENGKKKKKKKKIKRSPVLLVSSMYALSYSVLPAFLSGFQPQVDNGIAFQFLFFVFASLMGFIGFIFNSQTFALISASAMLVSIPFYTEELLFLIPAVVLGCAAYILMRIAAEKREKELQREQEEEEQKNLFFRQGEHVVSIPPQYLQQAQQSSANQNLPQSYAQQPIIINVQNANNNSIEDSEDYDYKSKGMALILALFLGALGVHRFYVGKNWTGLLYMLTGGLFGVGWVFDCVMILVGAFRDKAGYPLR